MQVANDSSQNTRPTILLIHDDPDHQPALRDSFRRQGYCVLCAYCLEDALDWMKCGSVFADIIVVDLVDKTADEDLDIGRQIRQHAKYDGQTPLVVMPEKYSKEEEGTEENVEGNDWIFYLGEELDQLKNFLTRLLPQPPALQPIV